MRRHAMITGTGTLVLRGERKIPLHYQFGGAFDDTRAGYLLCDTSAVEPEALFERLRIICDDGTEIVAAVMHYSDRYLAITGRVVVREAG